MLLAIEQGNTNTLFAVHDGNEWVAQWRTATHANRRHKLPLSPPQ